MRLVTSARWSSTRHVTERLLRAGPVGGLAFTLKASGATCCQTGISEKAIPETQSKFLCECLWSTPTFSLRGGIWSWDVCDRTMDRLTFYFGKNCYRLNKTPKHEEHLFHPCVKFRNDRNLSLRLNMMVTAPTSS